MEPITQDSKREIVADFARSILERKTRTSKPAVAVINFRNEKRDGVERPIEMVPISLLRYRKDNGRIASDVMNHEKLNGPLNERDLAHQELLRQFLEKKDPEMTASLINSIEHTGQNEPAIITADGFLINGNRRKMAYETLYKTYSRPEYERMKVVILPGEADAGGPPTLVEIEQLENRYQLQREGKAEYYGFDRALSIKRKMDLGFDLRQQLSDDPSYRNNPSELEKGIKQWQRDYLWPLACIDRYLEHFDRSGLYGTISSGKSDREGRWQAFIDYSKFYFTCVTNAAWRQKAGIDEDDVGRIEEAAFKLIKHRTLKGLPKIHMLMRKLPKICANPASRSELLWIGDEVATTLPQDEQYDAEGKPLMWEDQDARWSEKHNRNLIYRTKRALEGVEEAREKETPIALLETALKKLTHHEMIVSAISETDHHKARRLVKDIGDRATTLEKELYQTQKHVKKSGMANRSGAHKRK